MKLTGLLALLACLQVCVPCYSQQKFDLKLKHVTLEKALHELIVKDKNYSWDIPGNLLNDREPVSVDLHGVTIQQALGKILKPEGLDYSIAGKMITIFEVAAKPKPDLVVRTKIISGRVIDETGKGLMGANVSCDDKRFNLVTLPDGGFVEKDIPIGQVLTISYSGYETKRVRISPDSVFLHLSMVANTLDRAQVIAYGQTTQRLNVGNVTVINAKDIEEQPVDNPLLALEGRVPGLFVKAASGVTGGGVVARTQGQNSIANGNDPLFVVDGIPYSAESLPTMIGSVLGNSGGAPGTAGSTLSFLNPDYIESISVLKDADATAIYGSKAANGAILITTKKGKGDGVRLTINVQQGKGGVARLWPLLGTREYLGMRHEAFKNDGLTPGPTDYDVNGSWDTTRNTNWQKALIGGTSELTDLYAGISGGDKQTQYVVAGAYRNENSVYPGSFRDVKGSGYFHLNTISEDKRFKMEVMANYLEDDNRLPQADLTPLATELPPDAPKPYRANGQLNWQDSSGVATWDNPLRYKYMTYEDRVRNWLAHAAFDYAFLSELHGKLNLGYTSQNTDEISENEFASLSPEDQVLKGANGRTGSYSQNLEESWIIEPQIDFHRPIKKGDLAIQTGATIQRITDNGIVFSTYGFPTDALIADMRSAGFLSTSSSVQTIYRYAGAFGRLTYHYDDKYLLNLTIRRDGSSRFGPANRFHNFVSVGTGWIFSNENFVKDFLPGLSFGKIRGSYGTTGSDQIPNYAYMDLYSTVNVSSPYQGIPSLVATSLPNPNLQWEGTKKLQAGIDLGFCGDRILFQGNYVWNRSSHELINQVVPATTGAQTFAVNIPAIVQNTEIEIQLNSTNVRSKDFDWKSSLVLTIPANKVIRYHGEANLPITVIAGKPLGISRVFVSRGVNPATGVYTFLNSHGNLTSSPNPDTDQVANANTFFPAFYGGVENSVRYKTWELGVFLQFVKIQEPNGVLGQEPGPGSPFNQPKSVLGRWRNSGDQVGIQRFNSDYLLNPTFTNGLNSTAAYSNVFYVRVKNIALSWKWPPKMMAKAKIKAMTIFVHGENLFTLTRFAGLDPETGNQVLPPLRMLTLGIHVEF